MKRRTQKRKVRNSTRRIRKGLVFMGGQGHNSNRNHISNWKIKPLLDKEKLNRGNEIKALIKWGDFLKSIGLSLAEYNKLSQVQQKYIDSMYNNPDLPNNDKKGMRHYYEIYMQKSNNDKQKENDVYIRNTKATI